MINALSHENLVSIIDRKEIPVLGAMERVDALQSSCCLIRSPANCCTSDGTKQRRRLNHLHGNNNYVCALSRLKSYQRSRRAVLARGTRKSLFTLKKRKKVYSTDMIKVQI